MFNKNFLYPIFTILIIHSLCYCSAKRVLTSTKTFPSIENGIVFFNNQFIEPPYRLILSANCCSINDIKFWVQPNSKIKVSKPTENIPPKNIRRMPKSNTIISYFGQIRSKIEFLNESLNEGNIVFINQRWGQVRFTPTKSLINYLLKLTDFQFDRSRREYIRHNIYFHDTQNKQLESFLKSLEINKELIIKYLLKVKLNGK